MLLAVSIHTSVVSGTCRDLVLDAAATLLCQSLAVFPSVQYATIAQPLMSAVKQVLTAAALDCQHASHSTRNMVCI
jgi:hypothetical protein